MKIRNGEVRTVRGKKVEKVPKTGKMAAQNARHKVVGEE